MDLAALHIPGFIPSAKRFHSMSFAKKGFSDSEDRVPKKELRRYYANVCAGT
jgi:hypothetical protein